MPMKAACIDPKTGNLWGTFVNGAKPPREYGLTMVFDLQGTEIATLPIGGNDMAYDPHGDAFWFVNSAIVKLSREGKTLFQISSLGGNFRHVTVNPLDGSAWIVQDQNLHMERGETKLWHVDATGKTLPIEKPIRSEVMALACDPQTGNVWIGCGISHITRLTPDGKELPPLPMAATSISISSTTGRIWVATKTEIIQLDRDGKPLARFPFKSAASYAWVGAF